MSANLQGQHNTEMALQTLSESLNRDRERRLLLERTVDRPRGRRRTQRRPADAAAAGADMAQTLADELRTARSRRCWRSS